MLSHSFKSDQLKQIFESAVSLKHIATRLHAWHIWIPPIGAFTGARINEICQLDLADIRIEDGIPYFRFYENPDNEETSTKNDASWRNIPIHPVLLDMGIMEYADKLRALPETTTRGRLWPQLKFIKCHGFKKYASEWFNQTLLRKVLNIRPPHVFHCFRYNVSTMLRAVDGLQSWKINTFCGHAGERMSMNETDYNDQNLADLATTLDHIKYPIDWAEYTKLTRATIKR